MKEIHNYSAKIICKWYTDFLYEKNSKPFLPELSTANLLKKNLTAYYSLDKYFNKEITINWDFDTSNKKNNTFQIEVLL